MSYTRTICSVAVVTTISYILRYHVCCCSEQWFSMLFVVWHKLLMHQQFISRLLVSLNWRSKMVPRYSSLGSKLSMMQKDSEVFTAHHCLLSPKHNVLFWGLGGSFFPGRSTGRSPGRSPRRFPERSPGRSLARSPGRFLGRSPGRSPGRFGRGEICIRVNLSTGQWVYLYTFFSNFRGQNRGEICIHKR